METGIARESGHGGAAREESRPHGSRRRRLRVAVAALTAMGALALAACAGGGDGDERSSAPSDPADWSAAIEVRQGQPVIPQLVNSRVAVGSNRLAFGLFGPEGSLIHDAMGVELQLYAIDGDDRGTLAVDTPLRSTALAEVRDHTHADGSIHVHSDTLITVWGQTVELTQEGWWGAELAVEQAGERHEGLRLRFFVVAEGEEPAVGQPAPATRQPTLADGVEIEELSTAQPPNPEMHRLTIADALKLDRPLVVTFATPAFCQTRFCGPVLEQVVAPLAERYDGQAAFVHIEPFDLARLRDEGTFAPVPAMEEWGLSTEPWVFVVDAQGLVAAKFEGVVSQQEIVEVLERLGP